VTGFVSLLLALLVGLSSAGTHSSSAESEPWVGVKGSRLVNRDGRPVRLLGVNRSCTEYSCQQGNGIFQGPSDAASIAAIAAWGVNTVRVPLNESCWLDLAGVPAEYSGAAYRRAIVGWVKRLEEGGMYVVLDLQFAAPGGQQAKSIVPLPDADHAPSFWRSVASTFRDDRSVLFDLYTEPHDVSWDCWEYGCRLEGEGVGTYQAVGMARLVRAVRSTGARQPIVLSGIDYAHDLREWETHLPPDPRHAEVASIHTYDFAPCLSTCRRGLAGIAERHPVLAGELGETDCGHTYIDDFTSWADRHHVSYLGWAWDAHRGWTCRNGPSLIRDYDGAPTEYGIGLRNHLRALDR
jgi:hypothetical protein